ncbi:hypothetical protein Tco_1467491 [Tanacetum coccineum]
MLQIFSQRLLMLADLTFWLLALDYLISEDVFVRVMIDEDLVLLGKKPFNETYETPKHTKKVFTNMKRKGKDFLGRVTPLFASMLAPPVVRGEGSGQPSEPQPPSSTTQLIIEEQILTSVPIPNVADEAVFKERDDRVVRATTTAASLDAAQDSGNINKNPIHGALLMILISGQLVQVTDSGAKKPWGVPLLRLGGHTPGSDEGRPNINELMAICTNLSNRVLALEQSKTAQDLVINKLQKKVKRLEKALRARTLGMKLFKIDSDFHVLDNAMENVEGGSTAKQITTARDTLNTASINVSTAGPSNGNCCWSFYKYYWGYF